MELTKAEKKAARAIIDTGLRREMESTLLKLHQILENRQQGDDVKEIYYLAYETITTFDRHLARLYDGMSGSRYIWTILEQLRAGVISEADITDLLPATQQALLQLKTR